MRGGVKMAGASNYQRELDGILDDLGRAGDVPSLFLHSCCAPCSSYVLEYLSDHFAITDFFYNPNITDGDEYLRREEELRRLIDAMGFKNPVTFMAGRYDPERYLEEVRGYEDEKEGGERCVRCFRMRLDEAARLAAFGREDPVTGERIPYDFFATTLTISPLKDAELINRLGREAGERHGVRWLPSDFKKRDGFRRSTELSKKYELYRQDYCGCAFSKAEAAARRKDISNGTALGRKVHGGD